MIRFLLFISVLLFSATSWAGDIVDIRVGYHPGKVRLVIETSGAMDFQAKTMNSPKRLVIYLPAQKWSVKEDHLTHLDKPFESLSHETTLQGLTKISLPLSAPHIIESAFMMGQGDSTHKNRLVIDLKPANETEFAAANSLIHGPLKIDTPNDRDALDSLIASFTNAANVSVPVPVKKPTKRKKPVIVIDAGHGGKDPGAVSPSGIREKDITLPMARKIAQYLNQSGRYNAKLTRADDRFIKLYNRVKIARKAGADLFISVHADSVGNRSTRGASIYTLSNTASDKQTEKLAARENRADLIGGIDLNIEDEDVSAILIDLSMRETMNQSKNLANTVVAGFRTGDVPTLKGPHRYAGFAVLKAPDVPSILIETGFVSNDAEAKRLLTPAYQTRIAKALLKSLDRHFGY